MSFLSRFSTSSKSALPVSWTSSLYVAWRTPHFVSPTPTIAPFRMGDPRMARGSIKPARRRPSRGRKLREQGRDPLDRVHGAVPVPQDLAELRVDLRGESADPAEEGG